jgi:amino acid adenylation domain-containing protein/non-ribosomal peptide synthase protein (TIGR01720 family)
VRFAPYPWQHQTAKFDLTLEAIERGDRIDLTLQYAVSLFKPDTAERMLQLYERILTGVCRRPDIAIGSLNLLTPDERERQLTDFNRTAVEYPSDQTLSRLFAEQALQFPDRLALHTGEEALTYRELNARSDRLAATLKGLGVANGTIVALLAGRSVHQYVATLAIVKAGGAYMPMDPELPDERVGYMLQDSGAKLLLTETAHMLRIGGIGLAGSVLDISEEHALEQAEAELSAEPVEADGKPSDLAYVMYTSGTTGKPKGVMIEQRSVIRLVKGANFIDLGEEDRILLTGATGFDATTFEIWGAWLNGLPLYVASKETLLQADRLREAIAAHGITVLWLTSSLFNSLVMQREDVLAGVRHIVIGGEIVSPAHVHRAQQAVPPLKITNAYGPTENTTFSTFYPISELEEGPFPIGRPVSNSRAYVLNAQGSLLPVGAVGELYVGGAGLARGYLNNPELTAEKFVANPFVPGERMYRTGDLARWRPDGNLEFMGRVDAQVKIRGYRIEVAEIEANLLGHPSLSNAVVIVHTDAENRKELCAYFVAAAGHQPEPAEIQRHMSAMLPSYMVPSYFVEMNGLPLNANGKIDRRRLPEPQMEHMGDGSEYEAPRNETEALLAGVWCEVLGHSQIGIRHNFFRVGGDSIKAIQIAAKLKQQGYTLDMKDLFLNPTVAQLAPHIRASAMTVSQEPVEGRTLLTPIQRWFFQRRFTDSHHWNQAVLLHSPDRIDEQALQRAIRKLAEHHDALRMVYREDGGQMTQWNEGEAAAAKVKLTVVELAGDDGEAPLRERIGTEATKLQAGLDLENGPLLAAGLFRTPDGDHLLLAIHHLVVDGVSWRILLEDLAIGYELALKGETIVLPLKTTSFRDWSEMLAAYAQSRTLLKEEAYWREVEQTRIATLPADRRSDAPCPSSSTVRVSISLNKEETSWLAEAHRAYQTEANDLLLAAFGKALNGWIGTEETLICLEGHGREDVVENADVTRTVGWFTSMFPIALKGRGDDLPGDWIVRTKEMLRGIPGKGIGYGLLKYATPVHLKRFGELGTAEPDVSFNYLGEFGAETGKRQWQLSGLSAGHSVSPGSERVNRLDALGYITDGRMQFEFAANGTEFAEGTVAFLAERFKRELTAILSHCLNKEETEITPSDVGHDHHLSVEELHDISELLSEKIKL